MSLLEGGLDEWVIAGGVILGVIGYLTARTWYKNYTSQIAPIQKIKRVPIEKRDFTRSDLRVYDGTDPLKPLLLGVKGKVYDVSSRETFYGPGGAYSNFVGRDASRALGKGVTDKAVADNPDISDFTKEEIDSLNEWAQHYESKYEFIGNILDDEPTSSSKSVKND